MPLHKIIEHLNKIKPYHASDIEAHNYLNRITDKLTNSIEFRFDVDDSEIAGNAGHGVGFSRLPFPITYFHITDNGTLSCAALLIEDVSSDYFEGHLFVPTSLGNLEPMGLTFKSSKKENVITEILKTPYFFNAPIHELNFSKQEFCFWYIGKIMKLLLILNCSNITYTENKAPKFLNKKRIKNRKLPIYSYKTLQIDTSEKKQSKSTEQNTNKQGVRIHLRRGHIRKYNNGTNVFVNSCIVGSKSKGIIHKDYEINSL